MKIQNSPKQQKSIKVYFNDNRKTIWKHEVMILA